MFVCIRVRLEDSITSAQEYNQREIIDAHKGEVEGRQGPLEDFYENS